MHKGIENFEGWGRWEKGTDGERRETAAQRARVGGGVGSQPCTCCALVAQYETREARMESKQDGSSYEQDSAHKAKGSRRTRQQLRRISRARSAIVGDGREEEAM